MSEELGHVGSQVSCRSSAIRHGNSAGMFAGMISRGGDRMTRARALVLARDATKGQSAGPWPVPERWQKIYMRAFVKAALFAAHTDRNITVSSKYGVA